jgi:hypothetical protein
LPRDASVIPDRHFLRHIGDLRESFRAVDWRDRGEFLATGLRDIFPFALGL